MEFVPKWIAREMTRRCNLRCVHCRSSSELEAKAHPDFPTEEAFRIIDDITGYAKPVIVLSGGEPLLRKDVFEIARYGTLIAWAKELGREDCASVLQENLEEEKATDQKLSQLANSWVNRRAA